MTTQTGKTLELCKSSRTMAQCRRDPIFFCRHVLGGEQPWDRQAEILRALRDAPRVAVRSGHGVGKTWTAARAALWFLCSHRNSIVLTTAPTQRQVRTVLWSEIRRQVHHALRPLGGKLTDTRLAFDEDWYALGLATDEAERFQGFHAEHLLLILDEAPGVDPEIYDAARGVLTAQHSRVLLIGNPRLPSGPFYEAFRDPDWRTVHIPCTASPNVARGKLVYPKLVTSDWIERQAREWGRESPAFRTRVLGEFPDEDEMRLVPLAWVHAAQERAAAPPPNKGPLRLGVDVARYGADRTVLLLADDLAVRDIQVQNGLSTMETAGLILRHARTHKVPAYRVAVDDAGVGGGVTDRLREQRFPVLAVQAAGSALGINFANRRAELYWALRERLQPGADPPFALPARFAALAEELTQFRYSFTSQGRIQIESKAEVRRRLKRSPDLADALALTFAAIPTVAEPRIWVL